MSENEPRLPPDEIPFARAVIPALPPVAPNAPAQYAQGYAPQSGYGIPPDYMTGGYVNTAKPGVVTAIGVLSIVLGAFSIIGSGVAAFQVLVQSIMVQSSAVLTRSMAAKAAQQSAVHLPPAGAMGLEFDERQTAINVLASRQSLTLARQAQLDQLLSQGGQSILGVQAGKLTSNRARGAIQSSSQGRSVKSGEPGPNIFVTSSGIIELYDANAVFRPTDRSLETIRAAATIEGYQASLNGTPPDAPGSVSAISTGATTTTSATSLDPTAIGLAMADAGLSFLIALYLLVIGILTVRGNRAGGRLHWIYVVLKIPLIAFALYAGLRLQSSFANAMAAATAGPTKMPPGTYSGFTTMPIVIAILTVIYPISLILMLILSSARTFYQKETPR